MDRGFFLGVEVFDWLFSGGLALLVSVGGRAVFVGREGFRSGFGSKRRVRPCRHVSGPC